jgi:hypothetical protein
MELSPSCEAASCAATQQIANILSQRFNTVFTRALHWSPSWARSIQFIPSYLSTLSSILILSTHLGLGLPSGFFPSDFHTNILYAFPFSPFVLQALPPHPPCHKWSLPFILSGYIFVFTNIVQACNKSTPS